MFASSITLIGRIVADVVLRTVGSAQVAVFRIAVQRPLPSGDIKVGYYNVKVWNTALAQEIVNNPAYIKGLKVMVYGELDHEEWTGKDGAKHYDTVVRCVDIAEVLIPSNKANAAPAAAVAVPATKAPAARTPKAKAGTKKAAAADKVVAAQLAQMAATMPELAASLGLAIAGIEEDFGS